MKLLKYLKEDRRWILYTIAVCSGVALFVLLWNIRYVFKGIGMFFAVLNPITIGVIAAYITDPLAVVMEKKVFKAVKDGKLRRKLSVIAMIVTLLLVIAILFVSIIPQLVDSIGTFGSNAGAYVQSFEQILEKAGATTIKTNIQNIYESIDKLIAEAINMISTNRSTIISATSSVGKQLVDIALGCILAIYFLLDKDKMVGGLSELCRAVMSEDSYPRFSGFLKRCHNILVHYIAFDLIDGLIVGVANWIFMMIMRMPYAVMISVLVGVTNLAPTFGPIVGAVIGSFILVLINPIYAVIFLIFTIILQTVDGYVLKPKLFGNLLGVSSILILVSIIVGSRLFGVTGVLLAIPFAAIIDFLYRENLLPWLKARKGGKDADI